jgi:hypothetical protein
MSPRAAGRKLRDDAALPRPVTSDILATGKYMDEIMQILKLPSKRRTPENCKLLLQFCNYFRVLSHLPESAKENLMQLITCYHVASETVLCHQGQSYKAMYVLLDGSVDIYHKPVVCDDDEPADGSGSDEDSSPPFSDGNHHQEGNVKNPSGIEGDVVGHAKQFCTWGEYSLVRMQGEDSYPYDCSLVAHSGCCLLHIAKEEYDRCLNNSKRLHDTNDNHELFTKFPIHERPPSVIGSMIDYLKTGASSHFFGQIPCLELEW